MGYSQKEIDDFMDFLIKKIDEQNEDIRKRIIQFHEQKCNSSSKTCTTAFVEAIHETLNDVLFARILNDKLEGKPPLFIFPTNLKPAEKKEEKGGTGFYL